MADSFVSKQTRTYSSITGVDCEVTMAGKHVGNLQGVSYTVTREKGPNYAMGSANPTAFSRGKRGIAGSMIMLVRDRSNLFEDLDERAKFWASLQDYTRGSSERSADAPNIDRNKDTVLSDPVQVGGAHLEGRMWLSFAWYHDQIPPFDVVMTAITEMGLAARMAVNGVDILNSGSGVSIDDITTDENFTYVATSLSPWRALEYAPPTYEGYVPTARRNVSTENVRYT